MSSDERRGTIGGFIAALELLAKYLPRGLDAKFSFGAEHDMIYFYVATESCPKDSEDGQQLRQLGWHTEDGQWVYYT
jgi:hypothetical protein